MRAAITRAYGGPEVVEIAELPRPGVPPGHALVAVRAAALNHLDLWVRRGLPGLELEFPHIGGSELAGRVEELGEGVEGFAVGDRVLVNPALWDGECEWCARGEESLCVAFKVLGEHVNGGFAEFAAVPARNLLPLPDDLPFEEAAAVPLVFQTAWRGLISRARLQAGESVLVTGASGGVSTAAIQIAKHAGATVFALTSGARTMQGVKELGADFVIDRNVASFADEIRTLTERRGVDVVFDSVGQAIWSEAMRVLTRNGRLVTYGATTGHHAEFDIRRLFWKQLQIIGTTMASDSEFREVMKLVFDKQLRPVIDVVWPLERAREAHERLESGGAFGKIILTVAQESE